MTPLRVPHQKVLHGRPSIVDLRRVNISYILSNHGQKESKRFKHHITRHRLAIKISTLPDFVGLTTVREKGRWAPHCPKQQQKLREGLFLHPFSSHILFSRCLRLWKIHPVWRPSGHLLRLGANPWALWLQPVLRRQLVIKAIQLGMLGRSKDEKMACKQQKHLSFGEVCPDLLFFGEV